jgi:hypothetical protein
LISEDEGPSSQGLLAQKYLILEFLVFWLQFVPYRVVVMQDHNFDMLTNIAGLGAALLADQFYWWIDPAGAMVLAIYTIVEWSKTVLENAGTLCFSHCHAQGVILCNLMKCFFHNSGNITSGQTCLLSHHAM